MPVSATFSCEDDSGGTSNHHSWLKKSMNFPSLAATVLAKCVLAKCVDMPDKKKYNTRLFC